MLDIEDLRIYFRLVIAVSVVLAIIYSVKIKNRFAFAFTFILITGISFKLVGNGLGITGTFLSFFALIMMLVYTIYMQSKEPVKYLLLFICVVPMFAAMLFSTMHWPMYGLVTLFLIPAIICGIILLIKRKEYVNETGIIFIILADSSIRVCTTLLRMMGLMD